MLGGESRMSNTIKRLQNAKKRNWSQVDREYGIPELLEDALAAAEEATDGR